MSTKHLREALAFARNLGVVGARIEHGGKHPQLIGETADGTPIRYTLPGSPGDGRRGLRNTVADLRRTCRSVADEPKSKAQRHSRQRRRGQRKRRLSDPTAGDVRQATDRPRAAIASSPFDVPATRSLRDRRARPSRPP